MVLKRTFNLVEDLNARVVRSMLRLGRKYAIAHIENKALQALHHDYPTTLQEWDSLSLNRRHIKYGDERLAKSNTTTRVISIAHEFKLFTILPAAYAKYV